jgi:ATP-dependent helicase HepA
MPGQRWISSSELQMGLGTVLAVEHRTVSILFMATGETRLYARDSAPLTRVAFAPGDRIRTHEGLSLQVTSVTEQQGLLSYRGVPEDEPGASITVTEGQLDNFIQLSSPSERLFSSQIDPNKWFELRYQTLLNSSQSTHSDLHGLCGGRTSLIPHQLYIAHEVANRYAPRVLLADEVGLGKTIEAGMILHQQLLSERARRVLIVVPETLIHQWLVEMLRRFNLPFSIFDDDRWQSMQDYDIDDSDEARSMTISENLFHSEQRILCSLEFLTSDPQRFQQACDGEWDLLVVDEAHHLQWTPEHSSIEYDCIARLAGVTKGVLLLTATPEQLGKASHFARLRLLDPDRFPDFNDFVEEEKRFTPIAQTIEELLDQDSEQVITLSPASLATLADSLHEGDNLQLLDTLQNPGTMAEHQQARDDLIAHLLDRHGTGRVLFRNTRSAIKGFPGRQLDSHALTAPADYLSHLKTITATDHPDLQAYLSPELHYQSRSNANDPHWTTLDPRINWLIDTLKAHRSDKFLVITASATTALDITETLRTRSGIHAAVFHEGLTIIERDRAAAFFADKDYGSQVLVCSEIGSEGRNFQFAHHLVLFDLPLNPDLLEQRIGRLDRIGQTRTIRIHVPYLENTAQAALFHWYAQGLSAFEHTCPAGHNVFVEVEAALVAVLRSQKPEDAALTALVEQTRQLHETYNAALKQGRDRLLEYNSCRPRQAEQLRHQAQQQDIEDSARLPEYLGALFDNFGIDSEEHSHNCMIIRPGDHMQISSLPGLSTDGMTITYDRDTALINEDIHFITWEHPLTIAAMDSILSSELGNTAMTTTKYAAVPSGMLLLECLYTLEPVSANDELSARHLPASTIRIVIDQNGREHGQTLTHEAITDSGNPLNRETRQKVIRARMDILRDMVHNSDKLAAAHAVTLLDQIQHQIGGRLLNELNRLTALQQINPNIRADEIDFFASQRQQLDATLKVTRPRLDAIRVIIVV